MYFSHDRCHFFPARASLSYRIKGGTTCSSQPICTKNKGGEDSYRVRARPSHGTKSGTTCGSPPVCTRTKGGAATSRCTRTKGGVPYLGNRQPGPRCPLTIVALTSPPYSLPPGFPPLPKTDKPNHLLDVPVSTLTIPAAPATRLSACPHNKRTSDIYAYSFVAAALTSIPAPYLAIVHGYTDRISTPNFTRLEVAALLSVADAAWLRNTTHLSRANAASVVERFECTDLPDDNSYIDSEVPCAYAAAQS